nr:Uncharacterised protein [Raoultella sp. NCTC 9187]
MKKRVLALCLAGLFSVNAFALTAAVTMPRLNLTSTT